MAAGEWSHSRRFFDFLCTLVGGTVGAGKEERVHGKFIAWKRGKP